jgi:hypothetical protein
VPAFDAGMLTEQVVEVFRAQYIDRLEYICPDRGNNLVLVGRRQRNRRNEYVSAR